jgi:hypothetical protein
MSGYLSRLVTANLGHVDGAGLRPAVRSKSPIAEQDQRIGLAGFDKLSLEDSQGDADTTGTLAGESGALTAPAITPVPSLSIPTVQRKQSAGPGGRPNALSPASANTIRSRSVRKTTYAAEDVTPHVRSQNTSVHSVGEIPEMNTQSPVLQPLPEGEAETFRARREEEAPLAIPPGVSAASNSIAPPVEATRLIPSAPDVINHPARSVEQTRLPPSGERATPQVVIDRLNVEVIHPPPAATSAPAADHKPVSAASASVIGPLSGVRHSNLRFSLRHR